MRADLLEKALRLDEVDVIGALLDVATDPNTSYEGHYTPLMKARSAAAVQVLLRAGANVWLTSDHGVSPVNGAASEAPEAAAIYQGL